MAGGFCGLGVMNVDNGVNYLRMSVFGLWICCQLYV